MLAEITELSLKEVNDITKNIIQKGLLDENLHITSLGIENLKSYSK